MNISDYQISTDGPKAAKAAKAGAAADAAAADAPAAAAAAAAAYSSIQIQLSDRSTDFGGRPNFCLKGLLPIRLGFNLTLWC